MLRSSFVVCLVSLCLAVFAGQSYGSILITDKDFFPLADNLVGCGNGTLDLILFGFAGGGGVNSNAEGTFDADDANTQMPTGNDTTITASCITSIGELRGFYELNFPDGSGGSLVNELVLFVDIDETGKVNDIKLQDLKIVIDYDANFGDGRDNPGSVDIDSATQNLTGSGYSPGTILAELDPNISPKSLPLVEQGAGFADIAIFTGVDPFNQQYQDSTRILFFWDSFDHDNGGDKVFLSGKHSPQEVPEPATLSLLVLGGLAMLKRRRK